MPIEVLPEIRDTAGELGTLKHESWKAFVKATEPLDAGSGSD